MNARTGHVVKTAFGEHHIKSWKITDSQVALHWIGCTRSKLKMWVRNRVIEINRLTNVGDWCYVESRNMIADVGTRKGMTLEEVGPDSEWINGLEWMKGEERDFPLKTATEIVLGIESRKEARKESIVIDIDGLEEQSSQCCVYMSDRCVPEEVGSRYKYSQYVIDPNRFRFRKVVRVLGLVLTFIKNILARISKVNVFPNNAIPHCEGLKIPDTFSYRWDKYLVTTGKKGVNATECKGGLVVDLHESMIKAALWYFYKKGTEEIKQFVPEARYKNISKEINGIMYYIGRILPTQEIGGQLTLCDTSFDLTQATFYVPYYR